MALQLVGGLSGWPSHRCRGSWSSRPCRPCRPSKTQRHLTWAALVVPGRLLRVKLRAKRDPLEWLEEPLDKGFKDFFSLFFLNIFILFDCVEAF